MGFSCGGRSPFCVQRMHLHQYNLMVASCKSGRWNRNQLREISRTPRVSSRRPRNTFLTYEYDLCLVNLLWLIGVIGTAGHAWLFTRMMRVGKRRGFWRLRWSMKYILLLTFWELCEWKIGENYFQNYCSYIFRDRVIIIRYFMRERKLKKKNREV